ncbi:isoamyl alcohol [Diaporthe amygdali]|uniref:isoamyl alcohol n=1 Tax=Phomopsis amygdali TaxID=1214568 RepID=UPI0022FDC0D4|nr:isoamyl alcohol [Diaporthe amygdali]KAJ0109055.1 isoamyl alcohol [Diaporthe amygdali]
MLGAKSLVPAAAVLLLLKPQTVLAIPDMWSAFNTTVNGRLQYQLPLALPCFSTYNGLPNVFNEALCSQIRENYTSPSFRVGVAGVTMNSQNDACLSYPDDQCLLDSTLSPAPIPASNISCNQGNLGSYVLEVQDETDVIAAFDLARQFRLPLSIKNSGHDYMTRNTAKGSLTLWVHNLQNMTYHETFNPKGCSVEDTDHVYGTALTIGTGVSSDDATIFATAHNSTLLVGSSPTVAVSGGWVLGAGHSVLSPVYGLGIDRVVQFTVVTPDGTLRTANACQNEDLFWALRGGGGGTFGVVLDATHRVEPVMPIAIADMKLPSNASEDTALEWIALQAQHALSFARQGWGGHAAGTYMTHVNPMRKIANISDGGAAAKKSMKVAGDFILSNGGTSVVEILPSWSEAWQKYIKPAARPVGSIPLLGGRLWPQSLFETQEGVNTTLDYVKSVVQFGASPSSAYIPADMPFLVEGSSAGYDTNTSTHPAFYSALWIHGGRASIAWNSSYSERLDAAINLTRSTELAEEVIGPEGGAYVHESNMFTKNWQRSYWGTNYDRLLEIKHKYDPDLLLNCWKCVGFQDEKVSSMEFHCQGKLQLELEST